MLRLLMVLRLLMLLLLLLPLLAAFGRGAANARARGARRNVVGVFPFWILRDGGLFHDDLLAAGAEAAEQPGRPDLDLLGLDPAAAAGGGGGGGALFELVAGLFQVVAEVLDDAPELELLRPLAVQLAPLALDGSLGVLQGSLERLRLEHGVPGGGSLHGGLRRRVLGRDVDGGGLEVLVAGAGRRLPLLGLCPLGSDGFGELQVLAGELVDPALHGGALALGHGDGALGGAELDVVVPGGGGVLLGQPGEGELDLVQLLLGGGFGGVGGVKGVVELLLAVRGLLLLAGHLLQAGLKVPVLLLEAMLTLVENLETLLQGLRVALQPGDVVAEILDLLIPLAEQDLQVADLGNEGGADLGGKFDVLDPVGRLVAQFAVRHAELGGRARRLALELGRTGGALWGFDPGRLSRQVVVVLLDVDQLLAQLGRQLLLGLQLVDLVQLLGQSLALRHQGGANLAGLVQAAVGLCEVGLQGALRLSGIGSGAGGEELLIKVGEAEMGRGGRRGDGDKGVVGAVSRGRGEARPVGGD
ncbi:hypothetical protein Trco_003661 [Trichoderma cornu-damae]|uniref:Secreted protein n=1 Tax=Trichoderma cornu-damae TaxID=654480 RepID=A0A9P8QRB2_9HYPO|nr:hypothetical protein Trco_003661 [Trichoderma cornu-damae]